MSKIKNNLIANKYKKIFSGIIGMKENATKTFFCQNEKFILAGILREDLHQMQNSCTEHSKKSVK